MIQRKRVKTLSAAAILLAVASLAAAQSEPKTTLAKLYKSYEKHGRSSLDMPEFGKRFVFSGVVVQVSSSLRGAALIRAADVGGDRELARLTPASDVESQKIASMSSGTKFSAACEVGVASNSVYITLQGCVFQP
jgi:hypothetical protein